MAAGSGWRSSIARFGPSAAHADQPKRGELACSFCGEAQHEVGKIVAGQNSIAICDACTDKGAQVLATGTAAATPLAEITPLLLPGAADRSAAVTAPNCSFCGKGPHKVAGLVTAAGATASGVTICDECLALCQEIIEVP